MLGTNFIAAQQFFGDGKILLARIRDFANKVRQPMFVIVDPIKGFHLPDVHMTLLVFEIVGLALAPIGERKRLFSRGPGPVARSAI